jgi:DNA modification methylase
MSVASQIRTERIGSATLYCGDAYKIDVPEHDYIVFDPDWDKINSEWAVNACSEGDVLAFCDGGRFGDVVNAVSRTISWVFTWDCVSSWYVPSRPLRRAKYAILFSDAMRYRNAQPIRPRDASDRTRVVKNTRGEYLFTPDEQGVQLSDVYRRPITEFSATRIASHEKPIEWIRAILLNTTARDCVIYDPFMGGGVFAEVCLEFGMKYIGVEINEVLFDTVVNRLRRVCYGR